MLAFWQEFGADIQTHWISPFPLLILMWGIQLATVFVGKGFVNQLGIHSWNPLRIWAIMTAPFLHGGWWHLISNTVPFFIFGSLVAAQGNQPLVGDLAQYPFLNTFTRFTLVTVVTILSSGVAAFIGSFPGRVTVGASGIVFGYFGYLVTLGIREGNPGQLLMVFFLLAFWGFSMFRGVLPSLWSNVSWQGHLGGLLGGVALAYSLTPNPHFPF